jgi:hypothetical protein
MSDLISDALIGEEAEKFVTGQLGQKVIELARLEVDAAALDMRDADLKDDKKLRDIQNRIWRATQFESWLQEIINKGREALTVYKQQEKEDVNGSPN